MRDVVDGLSAFGRNELRPYIGAITVLRILNARSSTLRLTHTLPHATVLGMKSKLADYAEQQLIEAVKRMTHAQRLRAFMEHSKRRVQLQRAGKAASEDRSDQGRLNVTTNTSR